RRRRLLRRGRSLRRREESKRPLTRGASALEQLQHSTIGRCFSSARATPLADLLHLLFVERGERDDLARGNAKVLVGDLALLRERSEERARDDLLELRTREVIERLGERGEIETVARSPAATERQREDLFAFDERWQ